MKRICFDIASNLWIPRECGFINEPSQAREIARYRFKDKPCKFWAATAFDASTQESDDFTDYNKLYEYLARADEIITFNGRTYDLVVLEELVGKEAMWNLLRKPHHDLRGWKMNFSLRGAIASLLPQIALSYDDILSNRSTELLDLFDDENIISRLADTYRDAKFTLALFEQYEASGDTCYTFRNDWTDSPNAPSSDSPTCETTTSD